MPATIARKSFTGPPTRSLVPCGVRSRHPFTIQHVHGAGFAPPTPISGTTHAPITSTTHATCTRRSTHEHHEHQQLVHAHAHATSGQIQIAGKHWTLWRRSLSAFPLVSLHYSAVKSGSGRGRLCYAAGSGVNHRQLVSLSLSPALCYHLFS